MIDTKPFLYVVGAAVVVGGGIYLFWGMKRKSFSAGSDLSAQGMLNESGIQETSPDGTRVNYAPGSRVLGANSAQTLFNMPRYNPSERLDLQTTNPYSDRVTA